MTDELLQVSPHFSLRELTTTSHTEINNTPDPESMFHLVNLANTVLEVIRAKFGPLRVTSGYRSPELNAVIPGSAKNSAHCYGCAADVQSINGHDPTDMVRWVAFESGIDFDQVIDEFRRDKHGEVSRWMHIGMLRPGYEAHPRHQALTNHFDDWSDFK